MDKYEVIIYWSEEDRCFLAEMPDLPGCMADGLTREDALQNIKLIAEQWVRTAEALGRAVPTPKPRSMQPEPAYAGRA